MPIVVQQDFSQEATVIVWRNINKAKFIPTGHFGHAAIMLRGTSLGIQNGEYKYISWWPADGAGKQDAVRSQGGIAEANYVNDMRDEMSERAQQALRAGRYQPRQGQADITEDLRLIGDDPGGRSFGQHADAFVSVPGIGAMNSLFGLNLVRMNDWFEDYQWNGGTYKLASSTKSCAGVAAVALVEGGGEAFVKAPNALIYMEPKQVESYGRSLRRAIDDFNRDVRAFQGTIDGVLRQSLNYTTGVTGFQTSKNLWDYVTWKKQSAVKKSIRSQRIRKIDDALQSYHRHDWDGSFVKRYKALVRILRNVMKHSRQNPNSDRRYAVTMLGKQCIDVMRANI
ncbi:hypothetical protein NHH03_13040 [Stieleria sp. TO1_6]|uniref:hypothetical protein n=1 Tax=Stieleria tagensis TaxID=2956795 RepID=UPI00209A9A9C|nr:hypothetical protein [Stieleria tagensis]MCO8122666.1 hypothetical protein [Stieleria tagensis]